jgi:hypothetical protein
MGQSSAFVDRRRIGRSAPIPDLPPLATEREVRPLADLHPRSGGGQLHVNARRRAPATDALPWIAILIVSPSIDAKVRSITGLEGRDNGNTKQRSVKEERR